MRIGDGTALATYFVFVFLYRVPCRCTKDLSCCAHTTTMPHPPQAPHVQGHRQPVPLTTTSSRALVVFNQGAAAGADAATDATDDVASGGGARNTPQLCNF